MVARVFKKLPIGRRLPRELLPRIEENSSSKSSALNTLESQLQAEAESLERSGVQSPSSVYSSLLKRCGEAKAFAVGRKIHLLISRQRQDAGTLLGNLLVQMYGKCGSAESAKQAFDSIQRRTVFTWNLMLAAYAQNGQYREALTLFHEMGSRSLTPEEKPNAVTFSTVINICALTGNLADGQALHNQITTCGIQLDEVLGTCLINMYGKCRSLREARLLFDSMQGKCAVAWNTILTLTVQNESYEEALRLFHQMQSEHQPNTVSYTIAFRACSFVGNLGEARALHASFESSGLQGDLVLDNTLIKMYSMCGSVEDARRVFDKMAVKNSISWTTMSTAYTQEGLYREAMELYATMNQEGVKPHHTVFPSFLSACLELRQGKHIHARVAATGLNTETAIGNALVAMYGRFGELAEARRAFDSTVEKTVISWTSMIAANAQNGDWGEALLLFRTMRRQAGIKPNSVTCIIILDACSNLGTLADGRAIHAEIKSSGFDSDMRVNNTLVNMYGKCGSLVDARAVFDEMQEKNLVSWTSMLASYAHQGHGKEALELYRGMELEGMQLDNVAFVSVLSALSHAGLIKDCTRCFSMMVGDHGIETMPEHYNCLLDLFGRAGWLDIAKELLENMPFEPAYKEWVTFLGSCRMQGDLQQAAHAAIRASELDPKFEQPSCIMLLGNEEEDLV